VQTYRAALAHHRRWVASTAPSGVGLAAAASTATGDDPGALAQSAR
jgi:hypothetical protein